MTAQRLSEECQKTARIRITLNGQETDVSFAPYKTLLEVLREDLNHMGTKRACELGECGACAVILDGEPVLSCLVLALECDGRDVITIEGLASDADDRDSRLPIRWTEESPKILKRIVPGVIPSMSSVASVI
jgi:xanthine dehydrogenase iron-sulfur cluster and FAD-binding subunit A